MPSTVSSQRIWTLLFLVAMLGWRGTSIARTEDSKEATRPIKVPQPSAEALSEAVESVKRRRADGMTKPITIELSAGRYRLESPLRLSPATVGAGLTLTSGTEGPAVLDGSVQLPLAENDTLGNQPETSFWRFQLPSSWDADEIPRMLLVDGKPSTAARSPDEGFFRIEQTLPDRRSGFTVREGDLPDLFLPADETCDLVFLHDWSTSRLPVASYDPDSRELRTLGPIGCSADHYKIDHFETHPRFWLEGHPSFADRAGEWYVDPERRQVVMVAAGEGEANPPEVCLPVTDQLLVASGTDPRPIENLHLRDLHFARTRFVMPAGGYAGAQATMHEPRNAAGERTTGNRPMLGAAVVLEQARDCRVEQCLFEGIGQTALWLGSRTDRCVVRGCEFSNVGGNAINLGEDRSRKVEGESWLDSAPDQVPTANRVTGCEIRRPGRILGGAVAIWASLHRDLEIADNLIDDCPYTGISLGWIWDDRESPAATNRIHHNRLHRVMQMLSDGGGVYTLGRQPGSVIEHNTITDIPLNLGRAESNGMFLDQGTAEFVIRHNTIRRTDRSPLRFHQAAENLVENNRWELPDGVPPVRFNNTPESNITIRDNQVLEPQTGVYLIGNSLTWDTVPARLDGNVRWHVDCGKDLEYIAENPESPCVDSSWLWPRTLGEMQFNWLSLQPHYGTTSDEDVEAISRWTEMQPTAVIVVHTGWARRQSSEKEFARDTFKGRLKHSPAYFDELLSRLRDRFPSREFRRTRAIELLDEIASDIESGEAPLDSLDPLYRDAIHMSHGAGRYLMHNAMRAALGQPHSGDGFQDIDTKVRRYLDEKLKTVCGLDVR